jgi:hypothetical protein
MGLLGSRALPLGKAAHLIPFILFGILALSHVELCQAVPDGRIGVLYIGCMARSTPFWWMRSDPLFSMNFVQATLRDWATWGPSQVVEFEHQVYRLVRLYMPRSVNDLTSRFDVIILANANRFAVSPRNVQMLADGVSGEKALGLVMFGGWESFGGAFGMPAWGDSAVGQLLPTEDGGPLYIHKPANSFKLVIDRPEHEFMSSLPWDPKQPFMYNFHHNLATLKGGATMLAHVESSSFVDHPGFATWELLDNGARTFSITGEIQGPSSEPGQVHTMCTRANPWEYALDFGGNLLIYLDKRPVPQDVELVHRVRQIMFDVANRKSLLIALLEFSDAFGANTNKINRELDVVNQIVLDVLPDYFALEFDVVLDAYTEVQERLGDLEVEAVELKNRALMWVYVVEWLTVTGTAMVAGFIMWTIMVRRKLYKEVSSTKLITVDE